ncbi:MAG: hypothetical protein IPM13_11805 [Phycisphaerales bacterium]|nr:hypothetical protein [Phycisphaerales bacterium]
MIEFRMTGVPRRGGAALATLLLLAPIAFAGAPQTWNFFVESLGSDVTWTSPTAVDPGAGAYAFDWVLTKLEVRTVVFVPVWIDVTNSLPPEYQSGSTVEYGPAPIVAFDDSVIFPPPPDPPGFAADLVIGLNPAGFGYFSISNIVFGVIGPPYAPFPITLSGVRAQGTVTVDPFDRCPGDLNCDGVVDFDDIDLFVEALGYAGGVGWPYDCTWYNADADGNVDVNFDDIDPFVALIGTSCP